MKHQESRILLKEMAPLIREIMIRSGIPPELAEEIKNITPGLETELSEILSSDISFISAVYQVFENAREQDFQKQKIVCSEGCSVCCHQTFMLSKLEFEYIFRGYSDLDTRVRYSAKKRINKYLSLYKPKAKKIASSLAVSSIPLSRSQNMELWHALLSSMWGHACPFLDNDSCIIYEYRPLECRTCFSVDETKCKKESGGKLLVTPFDFWASDTLQGAQVRNGYVQMWPLPHWLMNCDFL